MRKAPASTNPLKVRKVGVIITSSICEPSVLLSSAVYDWFFCYHLDENTKDQESHVREERDTNDDGDERRGGKKEESHWWTRFQV